MRLRLLVGILVTAMLLGVTTLGWAAPMHAFDCKNCHKPDVNFTSLGSGSATNVCIQCHKDNPQSVSIWADGRNGTSIAPKGLFSPHDASNAMGTVASQLGGTPNFQTSHAWSAPRDVVVAAGAKKPSNLFYYSRYGVSTGKVTCGRCHDPHADMATNPKILRPTQTGNICLDCHNDWNVAQSARGLLSHPLVSNYETVAKPGGVANPKYNFPMLASGSMTLSGGDLSTGGVTCTTCHGVHWADSNSTTPDGKLAPRAPVQTGDGKILRSDGALRTGATKADTAQLRSNLCQTCHTYKTHGKDNPIGCLDCHSGHVFNNGAPNYFVLRANVSNVWMPKNPGVDKTGNVTGAQFTSVTASWMNAGGTGYCQSCHTLTAPHNGLSTGNGAATSCGECHYHGHVDRSFTASCHDCHGTPPSSASAAPAAGGYAKSTTGVFDYFVNGPYKDESATPHVSHAGGAPYSFSCDVCHLGKTHNMGTFQDVFNTPHALASRSGATVPNYNTADPGTCSAVYCHSNGGKRTGDGTRSYKSVNITWAGQKGAITSCDACHGNSAATMLAAARDNSTSHQKHLNKNYSCKVCHKNTADSSAALAAGAIGGMHVNGIADVFFDTGFNLGADTLKVGSTPYTSASGTCSVYCHSNGAGTYATPDWDDATTGACGTCHSATPTSGSHSAHLAASGANIACDACHGAGAGTGSHASHVNGTVDRLTEVASCNSCHGVDGLEVAPVWGNVASADCGTCHAGSATTSYTDRSSVVRTASAKSAYASAGHGKTGVAQGCTACHNTATDAAHMGAGSTTRLKTVNGQTYATATPTAFCGACHDGGSGNETNHYATTGASIDGSKCNVCHDPHGVSGYDAMVRSSIGGRSVATFADKTARASYAKASFDGVCQVCHVAADVRRFNQASNQTTHGGSQVCTDCHIHSAGVAFEPRCYGCHGGGTTGTISGVKNFWPDGSTAHAANQAGEHVVHMQQLIARAGYASVDAFLNTATSAQQKALCEYCHAANKNDDDHMNTGSAEVFVTTYNTVSTRYAKRIWDGGADGDAAYSAGSCSAVDCHNGKTTPAGYLWYDGGSSACIMCHNGTTGANGIPTSGSHGAHMDKGGFNVYYSLNRIGCPDCHSNTLATAWTASTPPSANHINGVRNVAGSRGLSYSAGSCGTNSCHNNGKNLAPAEAVTWGTGNSNGCYSCHTHSAEGHAPHFAAAFNQTHMSSGAMGGFTCTPCHPAYNAGSNHFNGTVSFTAGINYGGGAVVGDASYGSCNTTTCHQDGRGTAVVTPQWTGVAEDIGKNSCTLCHAGVPATGSHLKHVITAPTAYTTALANNTLTEYDFNCANCHTSTIGNHINSSVSFGAVGFNAGAKTCSASYCHSDGKQGTVAYAASPAWGSSFSGDKCAGCHKNSPDTNAHHQHEVGFHYKAVYSGKAGFLPVLDSDPVPVGLDADPAKRDQIRGHGGRLADGITSTSTVITCQVCHNDTVKVRYNDKNTTCAGCHNGAQTPGQGDMVIDDKRKHVNGSRDVKFFNEKVRSKAQIRDGKVYDPAVPTAEWTNVEELKIAWVRHNGYKRADGASYDESPDTLLNSGVYNNTNPANPTCIVTCHLMNQNLVDTRLDKEPVGWTDGGRMCIDCHTRLPR